METKEITAVQNLAAYSVQVDLAKVRSDADKYPRIGTTTQDEAVAKMLPIVYGAVLYNGQEITESRLVFMAKALVAEILSDTRYGLRFLSWYEIGMVIRNAVLGGTDKPLYGVSVATLYGALVDYARTEGHDAQKRAVSQASIATAKDATVDAIARSLAEQFSKF